MEHTIKNNLKKSNIPKKLIGKLWKLFGWIALFLLILVPIAFYLEHLFPDNYWIYAVMGLSALITLVIIFYGIVARQYRAFYFTLFPLAALVFFTLYNYQYLANILNPWAAIMFALVAILTILENNLLTRERNNLFSKQRAEDRDLDFKRRSLDEIVKWTKEIWKLILISRKLTQTSLMELREVLQVQEIEGHWMKETAEIFEADYTNMVLAVSHVRTNLRTYLEKIIDKMAECEGLSNPENAILQLLNSREHYTLIGSLSVVLNTAFAVKKVYKL